MDFLERQSASQEKTIASQKRTISKLEGELKVGLIFVIFFVNFENFVEFHIEKLNH